MVLGVALVGLAVNVGLAVSVGFPPGGSGIGATGDNEGATNV